MATSTLRPLSIGEILDAGIKVVARHWRLLTKCVVLFVFPISVISALAIASIDPDQLELFPEAAPAFGEEDSEQLAGLAITGALSMVTFLVVNIACFKAVCDAWLGTQPDVGRSLRFGLRRAPATFVLGLVWLIGIVLALFALIIPAIWLSIAWSLAVPALLFERTGPFQSLARSFALVKGRWWGTLLLMLVCSLLIGLLGGVVQAVPSVVAELAAPENALANAIATVVGTTLSGVIIYPYYAAVLTILYFDQRVRKEGFDLQLLAEGVGAERDPDAPLPAPLAGDERYTPEQRAAAPYWPPPPGWTPPPPQAPPPQWSSGSGWSAPSAGDEDRRGPAPPWSATRRAPRGLVAPGSGAVARRGGRARLAGSRRGPATTSRRRGRGVARRRRRRRPPTRASR